jgi:hypothetical protein
MGVNKIHAYQLALCSTCANISVTQCDTGTLYSIIKEKIGITSSIMQEILTNEPLE